MNYTENDRLETVRLIDKSQVFTPPQTVKELLDEVGYINNIFNKTILENSCGDGSILVEIIRRYISNGLKLEKSMSDIRHGLENNIMGIELDKKYFEKCLSNLDTVASNYGITNVKWNIINGDYLEIFIDKKFDFIVGNPPYISYRDLSLTIRKNLRLKFESCSAGKFDYCYAFIEKSLNDLSDVGKLSYIIPNSIFKNVFGKNLRSIILPFLTKIVDFKNQNIFSKVLTSSAILICEKSRVLNHFIYVENMTLNETEINKLFLGNKWEFSNNLVEEGFIRRFGDYFQVGTSIATQLNEAFLLKSGHISGQWYSENNKKIESKVVKAAVSPRSLQKNSSEYIIFPYEFEGQKIIRYSESDFNKLYPYAEKHLRYYKDRLLKRKSEKNAKWFEYGRSQALSNMEQEKLLTSFVVTNKVNIYKLGSDVIPYSGIFITQKSQFSLKVAFELLNEERFFKYISNVGTPASGNSFRITANDIKNYKF